MTHDERWMARYNEGVAFIEREHRNPSQCFAGTTELGIIGVTEVRSAEPRKKDRLRDGDTEFDNL